MTERSSVSARRIAVTNTQIDDDDFIFLKFNLIDILGDKNCTISLDRR